eukprot:gene9159-12355_t
MATTRQEENQDFVIGLLFLIITLISACRIYDIFDSIHRRKVITTFNMLIFLTALSRSIWFLIPNNILEPSYSPTPVYAYESHTQWLGILSSELIVEFGSLCLYGVFILISCYWIHMLAKLDNNNHNNSSEENIESQSITTIKKSRSMANIFFVSRAILECMVAISFIMLMRKNESFSVVINDKYWSWYILFKHILEIIVLILELVISSSIKTYDTSRVSLRKLGSTSNESIPFSTHKMIVPQSQSIINNQSKSNGKVKYHRVPITVPYDYSNFTPSVNEKTPLKTNSNITYL